MTTTEDPSPSAAKPVWVTAGQAAIWLRVKHGIDVDPGTIRTWGSRHNVALRAGGGWGKYSLASVVAYALSADRKARAAQRQLGIDRRTPVPDEGAAS